MMNHSLVFQKAYDVYSLISSLTTHFPKKDRYSLGVRLDNESLTLIELILTAETTLPVLKDRVLIDVTVKSDILPVLIRLALERKLIQPTNYFKLANDLKEISKMAVGWRKSLQK